MLGISLADFRPCVSRRALARLLSTFLCSVIIAVRPFSRLGGTWAFLVLTVKELVFGVQEDLALQLESTVFNVTGALIGIGLSSLARYLAYLVPASSAAARAMPAIFLVAISFFAGWIKSRLPRLQLSTRICCFISIWILTADVGLHQDALSNAGNFLWVTLSAATVSLFSSMLLLPWTSTHFADEVASVFSSLHNCLSISLDCAFTDPPGALFMNNIPIHKQLLEKSISLNAVYSQAAFELRVGRVGVKSMKPLIGIVEHLRRELSWGMSFSRAAPFSDVDSKFLSCCERPSFQLGNAILVSMKAVENIILTSFQKSTIRQSLQTEKDDMTNAKEQLLLAGEAAREALQSISDDLDMEQRSVNGDVSFPSEIFDLCLFMISLLQMAHEMRHALHLAHNIATLYEINSPRLWHPRLSWAWLGVAPSSYVLDERSTFLDEDIPDVVSNLTPEEARRGLAHADDNRENMHISKKSESSRVKLTFSLCAIPLLLYRFWNLRRSLRIRVYISKVIRSIQHSSHLRHAMKNAAGVALLSLPAFLPTNTGGPRWFASVHGQWMIISYVWVLETNMGATWRVGYLRLTGTTIGAIYAYVAWVICRTNPYALVTMVTIVEIPISWLIINTTVPSIGVVASVTLPPIVFSQYINPFPGVSVLKLAFLRGVMIGAGIIAALTVNSLIFPRHCRVLFLSNTSRTIGLLSHLYLALSRNMFQTVHAVTAEDKHKTLKMEIQIRNSLNRLSVLIKTMNDELSLLPKPMRHYRQVVQTLQKALDLMTGLRKIRENIPRKETVASVFRERRDFVSCICVSLFACEQVFKARQPLPQFLPSARQALRNLDTHVEERIRQAREDDGGAMGLSLVYAFAESEVLKDMVETIHEMLELTRALFGTSEWLTVPMVNTMSVHEEGPDGWYNSLKWER